MATQKAKLTKEQTEKQKLFSEFLKLKQAEEIAKNKRYALEEKIEKLYGSFDEKSKTFNETEIGFSINIKKNIVFKLDQEQYSSIRESINEEYRPEKIEYKLDMEGYKFLKENNPDIYKIVAKCVDKKDNKSTITIEQKTIKIKKGEK